MASDDPWEGGLITWITVKILTLHWASLDITPPGSVGDASLPLVEIEVHATHVVFTDTKGYGSSYLWPRVKVQLLTCASLTAPHRGFRVFHYRLAEVEV